MNRRWGRSKAAIVMVIVGVLGISTCSNDPAPIVTEMPTVTPSETPSPSPTPSPSATELTEKEVIEAVPPLARQEDHFAAQEFARYFLADYHSMMRTQPELFAAFSDPSCNFCNMVRDHYSQVAEEGHVLSGGAVEVTGETGEGGRQDNGTWGVVFNVEVEPLVESDVEGNEIERSGGGPGQVTLLLEYSEHWRVLEVAAEQE